MSVDNHRLSITFKDGEPVITYGFGSAEDHGFVDLLFTRRRYITFSKGDTQMSFVYPRAERSFFDELVSRGYDLNTFELTIKVSGTKVDILPPQEAEPGELLLWYGEGEDEDDGIDYHGYFGGNGAAKADLNMLYHELISSDDYVWDDEGGKIVMKPGFLLQAEKAGYNVEGMQLKVRQKHVNQ